MSSQKKFLEKVEKGDLIRADHINDISERVMQNSKFGGGSIQGMSISSGNFVRQEPQREKFWEGRLYENLTYASDRLTTPSSAECDQILVLGADGEYETVTLGSGDRPTVYNYNPFAIHFAEEYVSGLIIGKRFRVFWPGQRVLYGVADADIAAESTGTVSVYCGATDSGINISAYNITSVEAEAQSRVEITAEPCAERWILKPLECPISAGSGSGTGSGSA
jgi:hypothetical protein